MTVLADMITQETREAFFARALSVATTAGLNVTTWEVGDPTRTFFDVLAYELSALEIIAARYVASRFLDLAALLTDTTWIKLTAAQDFGYTAREATYATCSVTLTNASGNVYTPGANDLVFALTGDSSVTYHNTSGGTLNPGGTLAVDVECDVAGSTGSAGIGDIELVTAVLGVTASNTTAAVGLDEESVASIVAGCRAKLEAPSPNGAAGAYAYVALHTSEFEDTGAADVTRVRVIDDSDTGDVIVYVASSSGSVSGADLAIVESAIVQNATPCCVTPTVASASAYPIAVTYAATVYDTVGATTGDIEDAIEAALGVFFSGLPIGGDGDDGKLYVSRIVAAIMGTYPGYVFDVSVTLPAADVALTAGQVATLSTVTPTVTLESAP